MITKAQVKHIRSLEDKKYRYECKEFVVEGEKMVEELLNSKLKTKQIFATKKWITSHRNINIEITEIVDSELERISSLSTPNLVLAIAEIPNYSHQNVEGVSLVLDKIQDPGNLGSIVRNADWFGINTIYCSEDTVDVFNHKVVQSSMGGVFRVNVNYCNLEKLLIEHKNIQSYAAVLNGEDISNYKNITKGFIIIGNESKGISEKVQQLVTHKISIQRKGQAESLNAAVASGIVCHSLLS